MITQISFGQDSSIDVAGSQMTAPPKAQAVLRQGLQNNCVFSSFHYIQKAGAVSVFSSQKAACTSMLCLL